MKLVLSFLVLLPMVVFAANKPSMTAMWLDLIFLIVLLIALKIAHFSNQGKLIIFISYILLGILTKTIWLPVILATALFYYFNKKDI